MTISTQTFRFPYTATGGASVAYPYTNKILDENDLVVYVNGVLQVINTNYSVSGVGVDTGGNVTFVAAPAAGASLLITKDGVAFTQETDYVENTAFPAASHENALDKLTNLCQKIWDYVRRSIKVSITSTLTDLELPAAEANKAIAWNATADGFQNLTLAGTGAISDAAYSSVTWAAVDTIGPSKNTMQSQLEAMRAESLALISDTAYSSATWNGSFLAPSKNAVRDKWEALLAAGGTPHGCMIDVVQAFDDGIDTNDAIALVFAFVPSKIVINYSMRTTHDTSSESAHSTGNCVVTITGAASCTSVMNMISGHKHSAVNFAALSQTSTATMLYGIGGYDGTSYGRVQATGGWVSATKTLTLTFTITSSQAANNAVQLVATAYA